MVKIYTALQILFLGAYIPSPSALALYNASEIPFLFPLGTLLIAVWAPNPIGFVTLVTSIVLFIKGKKAADPKNKRISP